MPRLTRSVVCDASSEERANNFGKVASSTAAAAALAAVGGFGVIDEAKADIAGLTPCSESKQYARKQKKEINGLTKRLEKVIFFYGDLSN